MFYPATLVAALGLIVLSGCASAPSRRPLKNRPPDVDLTPAKTTSPNAAPTNSVQVTRAPLSAVPTSAAPAATWISLDRWARENRVGRVTNLNSSVAPTFALLTPGGNFVVRTGSVLAQWSGLELRLGFAVRLIDNRPFLHTMDLQKNLVPLLAPPQLPSPERGVIVLDPGHGGRDSGTRSAAGRLEKDYTLDWAQRIKPLLEASGWQVHLTRTNDVEMTLAGRVEFADAHSADLFLSLHFNSTTGNGHAGIETYCVTPAGMPSNVTRGFEDNEAVLFPNNQYDAHNLALAVRIHRQMLAAADSQDRGVRRARFLSVLRGQARPAVLLEGGYLSNLEEAALIDSPEHRQKLAEAVARALRKP